MRCSFFVAFAFVGLVACSSNDAPQIPVNKLPVDHSKENLIEYNRQYVEFEDDEIKHYIDSLHLKMDKTSEGIRYAIDNRGGGRYPVDGDVVKLTYSVVLLDGTSCPELTNRQTKVEMGKGKLPIGLEKAVSMLAAGGKGDFIIPALLAYGVSGRENCVPPYSPIRCSVFLNSIENKVIK